MLLFSSEHKTVSWIMSHIGDNELEQLEYLSLVSKVCTELDNHLGISDKDLAEFVISLAEKQPTFDGFKSLLLKNGAEFTDSLVGNLLRLIQTMRPPPKASTSKAFEPVVKQKSDKDKLKELFPALCRPDDPAPKAILDEDDVKIADAAMKELEMFMPSVSRSDSKSPTPHASTNRRSSSASSPSITATRSPTHGESPAPSVGARMSILHLHTKEEMDTVLYQLVEKYCGETLCLCQQASLTLIGQAGSLSTCFRHV
ncbi:ATP-dependent RNA helicase DHX8 [Salmo salar]|uniref:ATP-dependent RNA helicase DHX8 n=1 Tax=Salmo salar TaxID=8030 RepID=B5X6G5_SALSA|nr:ATP-dependent RNA helicase DHX8 [Salmo salar]ACI66435.1 ATP-dependent RNA helicase DHX8 [Salmo salar]|eukprot:NP_001134161.1 ATP-dependent RNA helicase DHX8 [Salmo salar]